MTIFTTFITGIALIVAGWFGYIPQAFGALPIAQYEQGGTGTSTAPVSQLLYGGEAGVYQSVATSSLTLSSEFTNSGTTGALVGGTNGTLSLTTNGVALTKLAQIAANSVLGNVTGATGNVTALATSTVSQGTGITITGSGSLIAGSGLTITNAGVTSAVAGTGIGVSGATGAVTITNNGVTSLTASAPLSRDTATGAVTISCATCLTAATGVSSITGTANQIAASASVGAVTLSFPSRLIFPLSFESTYGTTTYASSTAATAGQFWATNATTSSLYITSLTGPNGLAIDANKQVYAAATTTPGTGLTYSGNAFNVNTSQNIATLSNLTSNGYVKTSGGTGALSVQAVPIPIADGGTNGTSYNAINSFVYYDGTRFVSTSTEPLYVGSIIATSTIKASGFGTTSPFAYFSINPTAGVPNATAPAFVVGSSTATSFVIDNAGQVGVGTSSPKKIFHVVGAQSGGIMRVERQAAGVVGSIFGTQDIVLTNTGADVDNTGPAQTFSYGSSASGTLSPIADISGARSGANNSGAFYIRTYTAGTPNIAISVSNTQNVGIGTTTPQYPLNIAASTKPALAFDSGRAGGDPQLTMRYASTSFYIATSSPLTFATTSNSTLNATMAIVNGGISGLVGFATSSPYAQLSVNAPTGLAALAIGSTTELLSVTALGTTSALRFDVTGAATTTINAGLFIKTQGLTIGGLTSCTGTNALNADANGGVVCGPVTATAVAGGSSGQVQWNNATALAGIAVSNYTTQAIGNGWLGFGTTTPKWTLTLASSTNPQLTLTDASITAAPFNFRAIGTSLYISSSSPTTFATSTASIFQIDSNTASTTVVKLDVTGATSTMSGVFLKTGGLTFAGITSALVTTNSTGNALAYAGATCTNQFVRVLSAAGAATCATVGAADVSLANLTATNASLTFSGTYNGATAQTIGLNLGNSNTWTVVQQFNAGAGVAGLTSNALVGIGTTTPKWALTIASSTGPQIALTDTSLTQAPWTFRSINGQFYLATSTPLTWATSTNSTLNAPFSITTGGISGLFGIGSSTSWANLGLTSTAGIPAFAVGSTTATSFLIDKFGYTSIGSSSPWARFTMDRGFLGIATSSITVSQYAPATSTAQTVDCRDSNTIFVSLGTGATTITLAPMIGGQSCVVAVMNPNATAGAITWTTTASQKLWWASGGTTPTQTTTANKTDMWSFKAITYPSNATTTPQTIINGAQTPNFGP